MRDLGAEQEGLGSVLEVLSFKCLWAIVYQTMHNYSPKIHWFVCDVPTDGMEINKLIQ
jgi:hypothetical protein